MPKIKSLTAREILDSRGMPTVEATLVLDTGHFTTSAAPSGSIGSKYEAVELRDNDPQRFNGQGVLKAVNNINQQIAPKIIGMDATQQTKLDQAMIDLDGTANKQNLGSNATLVVSIACFKAAAKYYQLPFYKYFHQKYFSNLPLKKLPSPTFNIINGGAHGAGNLDFQEFHLIPSIRFAYHDSLRIGEEVYQDLKQALKRRKAIHSVGDEGGFAPDLFTNMDALAVIIEAIKQTPYQLGKDVFLGLDVAADYFYKNGRYEIKDRAQPYSEEEFIAYYQQLNKEFRLFSLEDPLHQDAWSSWSHLTDTIGKNTLIVGDDLLSTNKDRVAKAAEKKACNAILIKPNQTGTLSETISVINYCRTKNFKIIVSHRSGETCDSFIADFSVGVLADYTKFGAPARGERVVKYNRLLAIEQELFKK